MSDSQTKDLMGMQADAVAVVQAAEAAFQAKEPARLIDALQGCNRLLQALPEEKLAAETQAPDPSEPLARERALVWLWRGRLLVIADKPDAVVQGLHSLDQAIVRLRAAGKGEGAEEALVIAWMNRGSGLFRLGSREGLNEAVRSYDQAIGIIEGGAAVEANTLGAAWMNRGVGLMHLDDEQEGKEATAVRLAEAAKSFERAVGVLEPLAGGPPGAQRNLASAWANLGVLRTRLGQAADAAEAHRRAVELFRPIAAEGGAAESFELAARLFNLGQACGGAGESEAALVAGREALQIVEGLKSADPQVVELGLRVRHALCVVLGGRLAAGQGRADDPERAARLAEAGDLVEDGLSAVSSPGELPGGLAMSAARLYEVGAWLYRTQQPHFLGEFLLEYLGRDATRAAVAAAAVKAERQALVQRGFNETLQGDADRMLGILQSLGEVEAKLKERGVAV